MAALVVPGACLLTAHGHTMGQPWANVLGVDLGGPTFLDQALADEFGDAVRAAYAVLPTILADEWILEGVIVSDIQTSGGAAFDADIAPLVGTSSGSNLPPHLAIVATHKTGIRGKSFRGRSYLCGFTTSASLTTTGQVASSVQTDVINWADTLRSGIAGVGTGGPPAFAVVSRKLAIATPITETTCNPEFDHQDRRKRT